MTKADKIKIAAEAAARGTGPEELKGILKFSINLSKFFTGAYELYKENMKLLDQMYPEEAEVTTNE